MLPEPNDSRSRNVEHANLDGVAFEAGDGASGIEPFFLKDLIRVRRRDILVDRLEDLLLIIGFGEDLFRYDRTDDRRYAPLVRHIVAEAAVLLAREFALDQRRTSAIQDAEEDAEYALKDVINRCTKQSV